MNSLYEIPSIRRYHEPYDTRPGQTADCDHGEAHQCLVALERKARLKGIEFLTYQIHAEPLQTTEVPAYLDSVNGANFVFETDSINHLHLRLTTRETLRDDLLKVVPELYERWFNDEGNGPRRVVIKISEVWDWMPHGRASGDEYDPGDWRYQVTALGDGIYEFEFISSANERLPLFPHRFTARLE